MASFLIIGIILGGLFFYFLWCVDFIWGEEDYLTPPEAIRKISGHIADSPHSQGLLYDLGSCRGNFIFQLQKLCPDLTIVGIDKGYLRNFFAHFFSLFQKNEKKPQILRADFFKMDLSKADLVFVYLPPALLPALETKLKKELKPGSLAITYRVQFPGWKPVKNVKDVFVYMVPGVGLEPTLL